MAQDESETVDNSSEDAAEGDVNIPEDFQKQADALVSSCNEHCLDYLQTCISKKRSEMMKDNYTSEDMPKD